MQEAGTLTFLNPLTCGIYKDGQARYKSDSVSGLRTTDIDNELLEHVDAYMDGSAAPGSATVSLDEVFKRRVMVPTYFDHRHAKGMEEFLRHKGIQGITLGELLESEVIVERRGHGSPSNDQRSGNVPYVKVSDIRGLRINTNPTNLVPEPIAKRHWRGKSSGLEAWDLITPNRASSNIGEFAVLLPGEERIVLTKEVFVFRSTDRELYDAFYLLWALSLQVVRNQWRRIALMQTNREDCGARYREVVIPKPPTKGWAREQSEPFRSYFTTIARAGSTFARALRRDESRYTANVIPSTAKEGGSASADPESDQPAN